MTGQRLKASAHDLVETLSRPGWWVEIVRRLAGLEVTLTAGAVLGQWLADKKWDFLTAAALITWFDYTWTAAAIWIVLTVSRNSWHPDAKVSSKNEQVLLIQLANSARSIADVQSRSKRQFVRGEFSTHMVNALSRVYSRISDVRTVIYELNDEQTVLSPLCHAGEREPTGAFTRDDERGRAAIDFALADKGADLVSDVRKESRSGWNGSGNGYRTYIAAPIASSKGYHGMLTIDAPKPGDLTEQDKRVIDLAASILGVGFAIIKK